MELVAEVFGKGEDKTEDCLELGDRKKLGLAGCGRICTEAAGRDGRRRMSEGQDGLLQRKGRRGTQKEKAIVVMMVVMMRVVVKVVRGGDDGGVVVVVRAVSVRDK